MPQLPKSSDHNEYAQSLESRSASNTEIIKAMQQSAVAPSNATSDGEGDAPAPEPRILPPEAQRALAEAAERRAKREAETAPKPSEIGGRDGPDPVRYGDWESGGIAWDF